MSDKSGGPKGPPPILAGLRGLCPRCGQGPLFAGFLRVAERCTHCGVDLKKADSGDGPAVFIMLIVGAVVVAAALITEVIFQPPFWLHALLWVPLTLGLSLGLLRPLKGLMIAVQFHTHASDGGKLDYDDDQT